MSNTIDNTLSWIDGMPPNFSELVKNINVFLDLPADSSDISRKISHNFTSSPDQLKVAENIYQFIKYFDMFRNLKELLKVIKQVILANFDICENASDFQELLIKSILLRITEIYIDYAKFTDKEKILKTLSQSLEVLAPSALIINLGLMVKPIFTDTAYIEKSKQEESIEMTPVIDSSETALKIKSEIDKWIKAQSINIDQQDLLKGKLESEIDRIATKYGLNKTDPHYNRVRNECNEMLNMQLTAMSLIMDLGDEDLSPQPIH